MALDQAKPPIPDRKRSESRPWAERIASLPTVLRLLLLLVGLSVIGALLLLLPGMSTRPLTLVEALFTSVSALSVTGLSVLVVPVDLTPLGQAVLLLLIQIGGIGLMILTVTIFMLLGRRISLLDRFALRSTLGSIVPGAVLNLAGRVLVGVLTFEALGAVALFFHWREMLGSDWRALGYAIFHAISAFCNAGFDLFGGLEEFPNGMPSDALTLTISSALMLIGGLGVPVIADLLAFPQDRRLTLHTRITLAFVLFLVVFGGLGIFASEEIAGYPVGAGHQAALKPWYGRLGLAFFHSISARSSGFMGVAGFESLTPPSQLLMMILMFIGTAPASMGGGITTGTAITLAMALWGFLRNQPYPVLYKRAISAEIVRRATAVLTLSLLVVMAATWLILLTHPTARMTDALFEVVSAFATCGLTLTFTPSLNTFGLVLLMLVMIWGRLGALSVVIALTRPTVQPLVKYPEEQILIG